MFNIYILEKLTVTLVTVLCYDQANSNSMLGVHASVQGIIHFGKIARKHGLTNVALETLSR